MAVRVVKHDGGERWVSVEDLRRELFDDDDDILRGSIAMLKVGMDRGDSPERCMRVAIANWLATKVGDVETFRVK